MLFVCENNFFSVYSPLSARQAPTRSITAIAAAHGCHTYSGDGNDVQAVYEMVRKATEAIRSGGGPAFIELTTYRWLEHCGPNCDDQLGYRPPHELENWKEKCPIKRLAASLNDGGVQMTDEISKWQTTIQSEIDDAIAFAKSSPFPEASELFTDVFAL